jgi:hypothetical protein
MQKNKMTSNLELREYKTIYLDPQNTSKIREKKLEERGKE